VGMFDESTFTSFDATIDMTWTGTGAEVKEQSHEVQNDGPLILSAQFKGAYRDAVAMGHLQGRGMEFTPQPSTSAQIQNNKSGYLLIVVR
jgi:hypothetical protein